jgi:hypothetical protein
MSAFVSYIDKTGKITLLSANLNGRIIKTRAGHILPRFLQRNRRK